MAHKLIAVTFNKEHLCTSIKYHSFFFNENELRYFIAYTLYSEKGFTLFSTISLAFLLMFLIIFVTFETGVNTPQLIVIYVFNGLMT